MVWDIGKLLVLAVVSVASLVVPGLLWWYAMRTDGFTAFLEQWVVNRRIRRYRANAALFGRSEIFDAIVCAGINAAFPDPVDFSFIKQAYIIATTGVISVDDEPSSRQLHLIHGGRPCRHYEETMTNALFLYQSPCYSLPRK